MAETEVIFPNSVSKGVRHLEVDEVMFKHAFECTSFSQKKMKDPHLRRPAKTFKSAESDKMNLRIYSNSTEQSCIGVPQQLQEAKRRKIKHCSCHGIHLH